MPESAPYDALILGGGPAGAAAARLLSAWGHAVLLLDTPVPAARGLAESLPPSTRKLLAEMGVLDVVERAGFVRATGNTVWWAGDRRLEPFGASEEARGFQVFRPAFDDLLRRCARETGADVREARVRGVVFDDEPGVDERQVAVTYDEEGRERSARARFVLDATGRAGVIGRRFRRPEAGYRTCALVGEWEKPGGWALPDETHTIVETCDDGWMWSIPISSATRHFGAMVDRAASGIGGRALADACRAEIAKARNLSALIDGATLRHVWTCDASLYSSTQYAGANFQSNFLLVGDAGSCIDPLSSFGVKKALASAWLAAIAVHTCLIDRARQDVSLAFFTEWERDVYATHLRRSRDFARAAVERHPSAFWTARAETMIDRPPMREADLNRDPGVLAAFDRFRAAPSIHLALASGATRAPRPVIRDREIVLEDAFVEAQAAAGPAPALRFLGNVDLVKLADIACRHTGVPDVFEDYCRTCAPVPLPSLVGGLSLLVAKGILHERA